MPLARSRILDMADPGWVHAISRCVRRAFLAGGRYGHRRQWVEERLESLAGTFACCVGAFAVMSNHVHVVLRMDPDRAATWTPSEVAERWCRIYGKRLPRSADGGVDPAWIARMADNAVWIAERRARLSSLSWFMRALCEDIARRANAEDGCQGHFWAARFTSVPLLDQAALVACMAYVDLNPIRAGIAERPEASVHTSVRLRARARQRQRLDERLRARRAARALSVTPSAPSAPLVAPDAEAPACDAGLWLWPTAHCAQGEHVGPRHRLSAEEYLTLVDETGRALRPGKRGQIPQRLEPILARLDLTLDGWLATMTASRCMQGGVVGHAPARRALAERQGRRWRRCRCPLFADEHAASRAAS